MEKLNCTFAVTIPDFRKAFYFGMVQRHKKAFRIFTIIFGLALLYFIGSLLGMGDPNVLVFFIGTAYLLWLLIILGNAERDIRKYIKSKDCMLGKKYTLTIDAKNHIKIDSEEAKTHMETSIKKLAVVFEISASYLIYIDGASMFILPHKALEEGQREMLRTLFSTELKENFVSRFLNPKKR